MAKKQIANQSIIDNVHLMSNFSNDIADVVRATCKTYILTPEFIYEFKEYIDKTIFSESYRLSKEIKEKFSELFDSEIYLNFVIKNPTSADISLLSEYADEFINKEIDDEDDDEEYNIPSKIQRLNSFLRSVPSENLLADYVFPFMGVSNTSDEIILKRITDNDLREQLLLSISVSESGINISSATYKYMPSYLKENMLGTEEVSIRNFLKTISESNDIGWKSEMIKKGIANEIQIIPSNESCDAEMLHFVAGINENDFVEFSKIYEKCPNIFSYKIMTWVLSNKYFSEEQLILLFNIFKKSGCIFHLKKYARNNSFTELEKLF